MKRIVYLPFENIPQRYTAMWNDAICRNLTGDDLVVAVDNAEKTITEGQFLDTFGTIDYKARQMSAVARLFQQGAIRDDDVFYVPDVFYPGLEALRYMSELAGIRIKVVAFNHAGRADETDFVQRLSPWADEQEQAWHDVCDLVMVGSRYHASRVSDKFGVVPVVTGAVWDSEWMKNHAPAVERKEPYVIWPHRICDEKRWTLFLSIAASNPSLRFVVTTGGPARISTDCLPRNVEYRYGLTKTEYFDLFARASFYLSTAYQETFGYTIQEAIYFGCKIICPDYACYPEYVAADCLMSFDDMQTPGAITRKFLNEDLRGSRQHEDNAAKIINLIRNL